MPELRAAANETANETANNLNFKVKEGDWT